MTDPGPAFRALLSSDWNGCLAPCGPFDAITFHFPRLAGEVAAVFAAYTSNRIPLARAVAAIRRLLPEPLGPERMDAYLERRFATYPGVADLVRWCGANGILFMLNTTGSIGYFQRVFAKGLLPSVPVLSANPLFRYPPAASDPDRILVLNEISQKGVHTAAVSATHGIAGRRTVVMGDSGGDGPHFRWASQVGALTVAAMGKPSLVDYCRLHRIPIDIHFDIAYEGRGSRETAGRHWPPGDFMDLRPRIEAFLARRE